MTISTVYQYYSANISAPTATPFCRREGRTKLHKEIHKTNPSPNVTDEEECCGQIMKEITSYIIMAEKLDGTRQLEDLGIGLQGSQTFTMDPHE